MRLSSAPAKRETERAWLLFTPVWGSVVGLVMIANLSDTLGDIGLMTMGLLLGAGALLAPVYAARHVEARQPLLERTSVKMGLSVTAFAFLLNYFQSPFFFDVLHMHYGFSTQLNVQNVPLFLYPLTIAYFATYCALLSLAHHTLSGRGPLLLPPFLVAGLETALNANPFTQRLFCYDDMLFALTFGTFCYGTNFLFMGPVWRKIEARSSMAQVVIWTLAATMGILISLEVYRYGLAPLFTEVEPGAQNLRDFADSCLGR